jgi:hypothetical protein
MKRYDGHYLGIVVQNNDPEQRGRVKVFVPHVTPSVYNKWNEVKVDKEFNFIGQNLNSSINDILDDLKKILPWADCATPLFGASSGGRYNATEKFGSISDSAFLETCKPQENYQTTQFSQNTDGIGEKPGNIVERATVPLSDAFNSAPANNVAHVNPNTYGYVPGCYSNRAKGIFCIPNVGSHVWVFFFDGNPMRPVYWASSFSGADWNGVYQDDYGVAEDYPGAYENLDANNSDLKVQRSDVETYRNKAVISQKGGVLEFVNTDTKEVLKLTHYSGSFYEFNNSTTSRLSVKNDQQLVLENKFTTVKGNNSLFVGGDLDIIVKGNYYFKIGEQDPQHQQQWKTQMDAVADLKQLFEIDRTKKTNGDPNRTSSINQKQKGKPGPCPVCSKDRKYYAVNNKFNSVIIPVVTFTNNGVDKYETVDPKGKQQDGQLIAFPPTNQCPVCNNTGKSTSSMDGKWEENPEKQKLDQLYKQKVIEMTKIEENMGKGGSLVTEIPKHKFDMIGQVMNDFGSVRIDPSGKMYNYKVQVGELGVFENQKPSPLIEPVHVDDLPGGNYTINACNRYTLQVGSGGISVKTLGPIEMSGTLTNIAGQQTNIGAEYELNIDGGNRTVITSDILVLRQRNYEQVMVDSSLGVSRNLVVGGGAHIEGELTVHHITAPVEIQETEKSFVYGKSNNMERLVVGYVSPCPGDFVADVCGNWTKVYSRVPAGGSPGNGTADDNCLFTYSHSHLFKNLPLNLLQENKQVRNVGQSANNTDRVVAAPQNHAYNIKDSNPPDDPVVGD